MPRAVVLISVVLFAGCRSSDLKPVKSCIRTTLAEIDFGDTPIGTTATHTFVISACDRQGLRISNMLVAGANAALFAVLGERSFSLDASDDRKREVSYTPNELGSHAATLEIDSDADNSPTLILVLSGRGVDPCAAIVCNKPPAPVCDGTALVSSDPTGTCGAGQCTYTTRSAACPTAGPNATAHCVGIACGFVCNTGFVDCAHDIAQGCVDTSSDINNCGKCGTICDPGAVCALGKCEASKQSAITVGEGHACALTTTGGVKCWGNNDAGELGDNTFTRRLAPVDVVGLSSGVIAVSAGTDFTCALTEAGAIKCWGSNDSARLGIGISGGSANPDSYATPMDVVGLTTPAIALSAGADHSCAVLSTGGAVCWGQPTSGDLGDGSESNGVHTTPTDVVGLLPGAVAIAAGLVHSCALVRGGGVQCWGSGNTGVLGTGPAGGSRYPANVIGLSSGVRALSAGSEHNCAITKTAGVQCWGFNIHGQIGDGTTTDRRLPTDVAGLTTGMKAIAGGRQHSCAVSSVGGVKCWGSNYAGNLGDNTTIDATTFVDVVGLSAGVAAIAAGGRTTCALMTDGTIKCWGRNNSGEVGDNSGIDRATPVDVKF